MSGAWNALEVELLSTHGTTSLLGKHFDTNLTDRRSWTSKQKCACKKAMKKRFRFDVNSALCTIESNAPLNNVGCTFSRIQLMNSWNIIVRANFAWPYWVIKSAFWNVARTQTQGSHLRFFSHGALDLKILKVQNQLVKTLWLPAWQTQ